MTNSLTRAEVSEHNSIDSLWIIIDNKVYDVSKFVHEHPGGCEVLLEKAGEDRTEVYEDIGHSTEARQMKERYCIGEIVEDEKYVYSYDKRTKPTDTVGSSTGGNKYNGASESLIYAGLFGLIAAIVYYLLLA